MDIMELIDKLEDYITTAKKVPLTNTVIIDEQKVYEIIDQIRANFPDEIKQARWVVKERDEMMEEANKESKNIIEDSKKKAKELASENEILKLAESQSNEILENARNKEREVRLSAEDYADEMLANLEVNLGKLLTAVQRGRDRLQGKIETR
ncbi:MAG: ATPase [Actinobacteria bacterium]|nr:MAG: ATPase [Actinomycetota bacterium]